MKYSRPTCHAVRQEVHIRCLQGSIFTSLSFSAQILQSWNVEPISQYSSYCSYRETWESRGVTECLNRSQVKSCHIKIELHKMLLIYDDQNVWFLTGLSLDEAQPEWLWYGLVEKVHKDLLSLGSVHVHQGTDSLKNSKEKHTDSAR